MGTIDKSGEIFSLASVETSDVGPTSKVAGKRRGLAIISGVEIQHGECAIDHSDCGSEGVW
jgi:hypothetical protein